MFNELHGNEWSSLSALRECVGDVLLDADNPLMEVEMKRQRGGGDTGEARYPIPVHETYPKPCPCRGWRWR